MIDLLQESAPRQRIPGASDTSPTGGEPWRLLKISLNAGAPSGSVSGCRTIELKSGNLVLVYTDAVFVLTPDAPAESLPQTWTKLSSGANVALGSGEIVLPSTRRERSVTAVEFIDEIQETLSLSVTQIAEIIGVARATIHNWIRDRAPVPKSEIAAERLRALARAGEEWLRLSSRDPRRYLNLPVGESQTSLLSRLREDPRNEPRVNRALKAIAEKAESEARQALTNVSKAAARQVDVSKERESLRALNRRLGRGS
jgi:plasmid maintenance system antidote protein VapI